MDKEHLIGMRIVFLLSLFIVLISPALLFIPSGDNGEAKGLGIVLLLLISVPFISTVITWIKHYSAKYKLFNRHSMISKVYFRTLKAFIIDEVIMSTKRISEVDKYFHQLDILHLKDGSTYKEERKLLQNLRYRKNRPYI